ncbi:ankyrin repeat domain-containing protein 60 [Echinops telfairi]|uniref:Ankyrin repeat domain-containing protein 60 n=1 Tax=Echinops telfairi TaxID=9371 RepID=A0ABM0J8I2_ECHTE|nr:ankyrin repeat domain-containing protein 60 [Echinops telfairi]
MSSRSGPAERTAGPASGRGRRAGGLDSTMATPERARAGRGAGGTGPPPGTSSPLARARAGKPKLSRTSRASRAGSPLQDQDPEIFTLRVRLEETGEMFRVANCRSDMTVREFKEVLDLMVGIPFNLQRIQYLDQGVLMDDATLRFHDVVPGGIVSLCIWHYDGWTELVLASVEGDPSKLRCLGITEESFYRTANSEHFTGKRWKSWTSQRAFVALYIASHRGHVDTVQYLLEHGANPLSKTPVGRTPLHVAAAMGRLDCISLLLDAGSSINTKDAKGETPINIAHRLGRRQGERRMYLIHWMAKSGAKGSVGGGAKKVHRGKALSATKKQSKA